MVRPLSNARQRREPSLLQEPVEPREHRRPRGGAPDGRLLQGLPGTRAPQVEQRVRDRGAPEGDVVLRGQRVSRGRWFSARTYIRTVPVGGAICL